MDFNNMGGYGQVPNQGQLYGAPQQQPQTSGIIGYPLPPQQFVDGGMYMQGSAYLGAPPMMEQQHAHMFTGGMFFQPQLPQYPVFGAPPPPPPLAAQQQVNLAPPSSFPLDPRLARQLQQSTGEDTSVVVEEKVDEQVSAAAAVSNEDEESLRSKRPSSPPSRSTSADGGRHGQSERGNKRARGSGGSRRERGKAAALINGGGIYGPSDAAAAAQANVDVTPSQAVPSTVRMSVLERPLTVASLCSTRHREAVIAGGTSLHKSTNFVQSLSSGGKLFSKSLLLSDHYVPVDFVKSSVAAPLNGVLVDDLLLPTTFTFTPAPPRMVMTSLEFMRAHGQNLMCEVACVGDDARVAKVLQDLDTDIAAGSAASAEKVLALIDSEISQREEPAHEIVSASETAAAAADPVDETSTTGAEVIESPSLLEREPPIFFLDQPTFTPLYNSGDMGTALKINARCIVSLGCSTIYNASNARGQTFIHMNKSLQLLVGMRKMANCLLGGAYNADLDGTFPNFETPQSLSFASFSSSGLFACLVRTLQRTVFSQTLLEIEPKSVALLGSINYARPEELYKKRLFPRGTEVTFVFAVHAQVPNDPSSAAALYAQRKVGESLLPSINSPASADAAGRGTGDGVHICPQPCPSDVFEEAVLRDMTLSLSVQSFHQMLSTVDTALLGGHERSFEMSTAINMFHAHLQHNFGVFFVFFLLAELEFTLDFVRVNPGRSLSHGSGTGLKTVEFGTNKADAWKNGLHFFRTAEANGAVLGVRYEFVKRCLYHLKNHMLRVRQQQEEAVVAKKFEREDGEEEGADDGEEETAMAPEKISAQEGGEDAFADQSPLFYPNPGSSRTTVSDEEELEFKNKFIQTCRFLDSDGAHSLRQEDIFVLLAQLAHAVPLSQQTPDGAECLAEVLSHSDSLVLAMNVCTTDEKFHYEKHFNL